MKITINRPVEIEVKYVRLVVPVNYGDEDMPNDFPGRDEDDYWTAEIDVDTGRIENWPGLAHQLFMKVCDEGSYYLLDAAKNEVAKLEDHGVPHGVIPGEDGDYIELKIEHDGTIKNWPKRMRFAAFFADQCEDDE